MSSWSPNIGQETGIHISSAPVRSKELTSKNCGQEELGIEEIGDRTDSLLKEHKMRDVRDVEHCLGTIVLPSTTKTIGSEDDMLATAINSAKIFPGDKLLCDLNLDDEEARRRFLNQPWSFLREYLERSKSDCDTGTEECGAKTKDQKKLAVLPHSKYPLYGYCPSRDEFVVVKCKLCGMAVKPVAHRAHMHLRHNIGLKSPEPTTPVVSVISPLFPSTSSMVEAPALCSNPESISIAHEQVDSLVAADPVDKGLPRDVRRATAAQKVSCTDPVSTPKEIVPSSADNYVVVAPHSDDRPLKLTFRRARTNASHSPASSSIPSSNAQNKVRRKPPVAAHSTPSNPPVIANNSGVFKSRLRQPVRSDPQMEVQPQEAMVLQSAATAKTSDEKVPESWNHQTAPSTSTASAVAIDPVPPPIKVSVPPPPATTVISFPPPAIVTNLTSFQNHVYEHPKPLAVSRFDQKPSPQHYQPMPAESESKMDYGDHACYFVSSYACGQRRWPTFRRSTQSIRQACRRIFISDGGEEEMVSYRQVPPKFTLANGSVERPKAVEAEVTSNWMLTNGGGPKGRIFDRRSQHVAILRHPPGVNNRMVRLTSAVRNGNTDHHHPAAPMVISGEKFSPAPPISSTIPNKSYTKVSINQLKSAAMESGNGQVALDLGSLMCNGETTYQFKPAQTTVIGGQVNPKRAGVKRATSTSIMPSTLMTPLGPDAHVVAKKPRMQQQHILRNQSRTIMEFEEVSSVGMGGPIIQNVGIKPSVASQQLVKALQHMHNPNNGNRRKLPSHGIRNQLTPIVISPSHTPQAGSPHPQQPPQQQQVVLVSMNGPTVLSGWHRLTTNGAGEQLQQQTGIVQNGLVTTTATTLDPSASLGTRVIRPKLTTNPVSLPVFVAHSDQIQVQSQPYRQPQTVWAHKLATPVSSGGSMGAYQTKQMAQARFARRSNSTIALDELSQRPVPQQQQQLAQFRPIQPAQQLAFGHTGGIRTTAVSNAPVIAGQIVLNVATVPKGGLNVTATPTSTMTMGTIIGQQVSRQSSTPTSGGVNVNAPLSFLAASNTGYVTASNSTPATPGIYSS